MPMPDSNQDIKDIIAAEMRWIDGSRQGDTEACASMLADGFTYTSLVGSTVARQSYLDDLLHNRSVIMAAAAPTESDVRFFGDAAFVTADRMIDDNFRGAAFKRLVCLTRSWVRDAGSWKAVSLRVTAARKR